MSKNQLINLISPTSRGVFKIEKYIAKLSKKQLKDFAYHNYGYLFSKTKDEVCPVLNKHIKQVFKNFIKKYHEQKRLHQGLSLSKDQNL